MTDGGDGVFERSAVVSAILGETRNSVTLHPILIGYSATYLLALAFGGDAEEVKASLPVTSEGGWFRSMRRGRPILRM